MRTMGAWASSVMVSSHPDAEKYIRHHWADPQNTQIPTLVGRRKRSIASTKVKHVVAPTDTRTHIGNGEERQKYAYVCRGRYSRVRSQDGHGVRGTERNMDRNIDGFRSKGRSKDRSTNIFMVASISRYGKIDAWRGRIIFLYERTAN